MRIGSALVEITGIKIGQLRAGKKTVLGVTGIDFTRMNKNAARLRLAETLNSYQNINADYDVVAEAEAILAEHNSALALA